MKHDTLKNFISQTRRHLSKGCWQVDKTADFMDSPSASEDTASKMIDCLTAAEYEIESAMAKIQSFRQECCQLQSKSYLLDGYSNTAGGEIEVIGNNHGTASAMGAASAWLHLKLDTLLPNTKNNIGVKNISNTIDRLLDYYSEYYGSLPKYEKAFLAIIEHRKASKRDTFDHDNKGFKAIPNALKGRVISDDNQFRLSLGLFSIPGADMEYTEIFVIPMTDIVDFSLHYLYHLG